jgi:hypothetical protein
LKVLGTGRKRDKQERRKKERLQGREKGEKKLLMSMYCTFQPVTINTSTSVTKPSHRTHNY